MASVPHGGKLQVREPSARPFFGCDLTTNLQQDLIARDAHLHDALLEEAQALQDIVLSEVSPTRTAEGFSM
jgi:hypothetical protein